MFRLMCTLSLAAFLSVPMMGCDLRDPDPGDVDWRVAAPIPSYYRGTFSTSGHVGTLCLKRDEQGGLAGEMWRGNTLYRIVGGTYASFTLTLELRGLHGTGAAFEGTLYAESLFAPVLLEGEWSGDLPGMTISSERFTARMVSLGSSNCSG